ncbi:MAG TPA: GerAB/ArcD/ProY family transporter, partial [Clostridiales bacterium]|nr:GerAB/ArcD/ProY family transporter [Clostridiales bacterium]
MSKDLTIRQAGFLFILLSLSPAMRQLPNIIFGGKDNEILLVLISYLIIIGLTSCILYLMKKNQGKNIYEISNIVFGKIISKFLMIVIATWMLVLISSRINIYVFTIQLTMMPNTRAFIFILTMFALVFYAISKGMKTVFRISEFTLGMIILIIIFFIIFSLNN